LGDSIAPPAQALPAILLALQIATLGWRINREIPLGDKGERTWFPVADYLNVLSMVSVVFVCIVMPINFTENKTAIRIALTAGFILIGLYPLNLMAHYRFFSRLGRHKYILKKQGFPYITDQEWVTLIITIVITGTYLVLTISQTLGP
jgi:hypothetical protein